MQWIKQVYWCIGTWFTYSWWQYLLTDLGSHRYYPPWRHIICRAKGHPNGVFWFSNGGDPDMTCKDCGDDLG